MKIKFLICLALLWVKFVISEGTKYFDKIRFADLLVMPIFKTSFESRLRIRPYPDPTKPIVFKPRLCLQDAAWQQADAPPHVPATLRLLRRLQNRGKETTFVIWVYS